MSKKATYKIEFGALKSGEYSYDFEVGDDFWAEFPASGIMGGELSVAVDMVRQATGLTIDVAIDGEVRTECDRCLDELALPVEYDGTLTVRFLDETEDEYDGETMFLPTTATEVDLKQYIYESILLLPLQRVHEEGECNKEMLEKLKVEN